MIVFLFLVGLIIAKILPSCNQRMWSLWNNRDMQMWDSCLRCWHLASELQTVQWVMPHKLHSLYVFVGMTPINGSILVEEEASLPTLVRPRWRPPQVGAQGQWSLFFACLAERCSAVGWCHRSWTRETGSSCSTGYHGFSPWLGAWTAAPRTAAAPRTERWSLGAGCSCSRPHAALPNFGMTLCLMRRSSKPEPWLSCLASRAFPTKALMQALHGLRCWDTGPLPEAVSPWERSRCRTCCWMVCASSPSSGKDGQLAVNDQQFGQLLDRLWRVGRMAEGQFQPPNQQGATGDVGSYHYFPTFDQPPWYWVWTWLSILLHGFQQHGVLIMQPPKVQSCLLHQCPVEWTKVLPRFP